MNKEQKQEVIEALKNKFSQYSNFYITDTQNLSVAQITNLRRHCFDKKVEMKVAKNTLIKKALESLDNDKYSGVYDSLHQVTALMFSDSPKEPALIISSFRKSLNGEKPLLKAAFLNGDIFVGDNQLSALSKIKTKNELIGEVIGLLMSPIQRVIGALQNRFETTEATDLKTETTEVKDEVAEPKPVATEAKSGTQPATETKPEITEPASAVAKSSPKVEVDGPKSVTTEPTSETAPVTEIKAAITEPVPDAVKSGTEVEVPEPEAVATEDKSGTQPVTETKSEVTEPAAPETTNLEAKTEVAGPKAEATDAKPEPQPAAETKPGINEPTPDTGKSEAKGNETQPDA